jgi:hypothetical protein
MPRGTGFRDCSWDHLVQAAIKAGFNVPLIYAGIETPDRALEIKRGIYRCARHRKVSVQVTWPYKGQMTSKSDQWPPDKVNGTYQLTILLFLKTHGRKHVVDKHGTDRQQWPYNPRRKTKEASR